MNVKITTITCQRCGKEWIPRIPDPRLCPRCKSTRFDTPRTGNEVGAKPKRERESSEKGLDN